MEQVSNMYNFLADFSDNRRTESDVKVILVTFNYYYSVPEQQTLRIGYELHFDSDLELEVIEVSGEILETFNINNRDTVEECVLDYLKTKSEFSNIRNVT